MKTDNSELWSQRWSSRNWEKIVWCKI